MEETFQFSGYITQSPVASTKINKKKSFKNSLKCWQRNSVKALGSILVLKTRKEGRKGKERKGRGVWSGREGGGGSALVQSGGEMCGEAVAPAQAFPLVCSLTVEK